jgi:Zn-dependent protease
MTVAPQETSNDIEDLRRIVERYFSVYETATEPHVTAFFIDLPLNEEVLKERFGGLTDALKEKNHVPLLREKNGEYVIFVTYRPTVKGRSKWVNILLFAATVVTTMIMGTLLYLEWMAREITLATLLEPSHLAHGIVLFSLPLLSILGIHELGHFLLSRHHNVAASLPFFIPIPLPPFGTMGAVISMREPIPDRKSLLDIGIAGPIAGFVLTIPVLCIGLFFMQENPNIVTDTGPDTLQIYFPLLGIALSQLFSIPDNALIHPTALAGWVGLFVTAINLLPAGQLDGGHIARAVLKEKHRYASLATIIGLAALTLLGLGNWLLLLLLLVFLIGTEHPPPLNEYVSLDPASKLLAVVAVFIFIMSFTPLPISS